MSALTEETWRAVAVKLTSAEVEKNRRGTEKILGRMLPPRPTPTARGRCSDERGGLDPQ
ncbi:hypothetical protein [Nocardia sp. NBC_01388]|uniref:hypothetical protein n=1 Tax=Nocardia sp. NBC_01388 TaxID=2903596 RepID=UPI00325105E1